MISKFLEQRDFPIRDFLNELSKRELLFFHFVISHDESEISQICGGKDDINEFYLALNKMSKTNVNLKKLSKDDLIDSIAEEYGDSAITKLIYKSIYNYSKKGENIFKSSKIVAIERFVNTLFLKNINKLMDDFSTKGISINFVEKEFEKRFCFANKPVLNSVGLVSLIAKIDLTVEDFFDGKPPFIINFREEIIRMLFESFYYLKISENLELIKQKKESELQYKKLQEQIKRKDEVIEKQKENNKKISVELKDLKKQITKEDEKKETAIDKETITNLSSDIHKKNLQIEQLTKDIKLLKEKSTNNYNIMLGNLNEQISSLKLQNNQKQSEIKELKKILEEYQNRKPKDILSNHLRINGLSEDIYLLVEPYVTEYKEMIEFKEQLFLYDDINEQSKIDEPIYKIGYCQIEENVHYAMFTDKTKIPIINLPESTYIAECQFIKVLSDGTFKWAYTYKYEEHDRDNAIAGFGWISYRGADIFVCKANGECFRLENIPNYIQLKENQIVSFDSKNQLLRFYRNIRHNVDEYISSIKAKGQKIFYVLKSFQNGVLIRDVETDREEFKILNMGEREIKEQQIICMKDDVILNIFSSSKFYTFSSYYKNASIGMIEKKNDIVFVKKLSGEVAILNEIPIGIDIQDGDIVKVDEFNNLLFVKHEDSVSKTGEETRRRAQANQLSTTKKVSTDNIEIEKEVLIVGNINYENSYKMSLFKNGYRAEVVDGYSPWTRIKALSKDKDCVIVVTNFISHENMWKIKEDILDIPVIYSEFDGANRIVEKIASIDYDNEIT